MAASGEPKPDELTFSNPTVIKPAVDRQEVNKKIINKKSISTISFLAPGNK